MPIFGFALVVLCALGRAQVFDAPIPPEAVELSASPTWEALGRWMSDGLDVELSGDDVSRWREGTAEVLRSRPDSSLAEAAAESLSRVARLDGDKKVEAAALLASNGLLAYPKVPGPKKRILKAVEHDGRIYAATE